VAPRDSMLNSSAPYLRYGEPVQAVIGAQAARPGRATLAGLVPGFARYRIIVATPGRILVLDAGRTSLRKARGVVAELPRDTRLGHPGTGLWHQIPVGSETLRVHRRFFADIETSDATATTTTLAAA
jgi:hypothetical protein